MDPSALIPTPDPIPVHWGWFQFLTLLTFALHLLFMNAMLGSGVLALVNGARRQSETLALSRDAAGTLPVAVAFAVNLGVAPLLFLQVLYGQFLYVSTVLMAAWWVGMIVLLIAAYYAIYVFTLRFDALGGARTLVIGFAVALLLFVGFLFSNNMTLMTTPGRWTRYFASPGGTLLNLGEPTLWPRYLHFVMASVAIGALWQAWLGHRQEGRGEVRGTARKRQGLLWFSWATVAQMILGVWFLFALPRPVMLLFMGDSGFATALLLIGLAAAILALVFGFLGRLRPAAVHAVLTVVVMVLMRDVVRRAYLSPWFDPAALPERTQYSPLVLFLVAFVIGLGVLAWMLRLASRAGKEA
jgi:hypothetical protein